MPATALKPRISKEAVANAKKFNGKQIGKEIANMRGQLRIEAEDIEKAVGITVDRLGEIEADASNATLKEIHQISSVFEYTFGGLVGRLAKKSGAR